MVMDRVRRRMIQQLQNYIGVGTYHVKGRKWVCCPCCGKPGHSARTRIEWYRAAKKWEKRRWQQEELDE